MKQDATFFEGKEAILVYIAKKLKDALRLEGILTAAGLDYGVEADHYYGGYVFRSQRIGAFFYVLPDSAEITRRLMQENAYRPFEGELKPDSPPRI